MNDQPSLPAWLPEALRAPVASSEAARARIMAQVRAAGGPPRPVRAPLLFGVSRWRRRGMLSGLGSALVTALLALLLTVRHGDELTWSRTTQAQALVTGDSVVPTHADSLVARVGARLLDTLRIVDLVLRGPSMGRAVITVADARVQASLVRTSAGATEWHARALVPRDMVALTLVVDGATHALPLTRPTDAPFDRTSSDSSSEASSDSLSDSSSTLFHP